MLKHRFHLLGVILLLVLFSSCGSKESTIIRTADQLLWENPDSCLRYIEAHKSEIHKREQMRMELISQHATFKISDDIGDTLLSQLAEKSQQVHNPRIAGEANYILGVYHTLIGEYFSATQYLKHAQAELQKAPNTNPTLLGMLYFYLGAAAEQGRLFELANEYYQTALPHLIKGKNALYMASCYHRIGKSTQDSNLGLSYLDSALYYSQQVPNPLYYKEIETSIYLLHNSSRPDSIQLLENNLHYLCDSCGVYSYAAEIAELHIQKNELAEATMYLEKLALDTSINIWSKEQYCLLSAEILLGRGKAVDAYNVIKDLHIEQTNEIQSSAFTYCYIISQKYDAAKEQEMRLQETVKKQRAYFWIAICVLLCILIGGYTYYIYRKGQYELRLREEQNLRMEQQLENNRAVLKARLNERLHVARKMHFWNSHHKEQMPTEFNMLSPTQASKDQENWRKFYDDFNICYDNLLLRLKEQHPALTDSDLQYIALTYMHFDVTDLSFLLDVTNRTVWNRRNVVKQHLNMPQEDDLDSWIANL